MTIQRNSIDVHIEKNALVDEGDGTISFRGGQVIVDDTTMWSGYSYDIESLDVSQYKGQVTADHVDSVHTLVGRAPGAYKRGNQVLIDSIRFAVNESPTARLAYDLIKGGFLTDFSVETMGPYPGEDDKKYYQHAVAGLSVVVAGNNKNAHMSREASLVVANSIASAREDGLDGVEKLEEAVKPMLHVEQAKQPEPSKQTEETKEVNNKQEQEEMSYKTVKNTRDFPVSVRHKNAAGEDVETTIAVGNSIDVAEDQAADVTAQINAAQKPVDIQAAIENAMKEADEKHKEELEKLENSMKEMFNQSAKEPEFTKAGDHKVRNTATGASQKLADMDWRERTKLAVNSALEASKGNSAAGETLKAINTLHIEQHIEDGTMSAQNALDLPDTGNFVIPREMQRDIKEQASNYSSVLNLFNFEETLSLETAWIKGNGEIQMSDVDMDDNGDNGELKPISTPGFTTDTTRLKEFAAVTPVQASALRFAAVDLVGHITRLYRRAYDKALAQSVIGRLEQAVESNGNSIPYSFNTAAGGDIGALVAFIRALALVAENSPNGVFLMTEGSRLDLVSHALKAGSNGPLSDLFAKGPDGIPTFLGHRYAVVSGDLLPNLNTASTKTWTFEEETVTVNHGILLADPTDFVGRVSGGLNFQVSDSAAYEQGGSVKSAWQRDQVVFRGYGYRASGLYFDENVSGVLAPGIS